MTDVQITYDPIDTAQCIAKVITPECGGIDVFIGTVRSSTKGKKVIRLQFECYESMAISEMNKIALHLHKEFGAKNVLIHHRTGILNISEIAVLIAVAAPHRDAAFTACRYAIDTLKETVPIWKKEIFDDGEIWVSATP